jgi:hypothetical protein
MRFYRFEEPRHCAGLFYARKSACAQAGDVMTIEYKVRPVKRFIVTRFESDGSSASSTQVGEYQNGTDADLVADTMVALDKSKGIDSIRLREGLSLGEYISGKRCE